MLQLKPDLTNKAKRLVHTFTRPRLVSPRAVLLLFIPPSPPSPCVCSFGSVLAVIVQICFVHPLRSQDDGDDSYEFESMYLGQCHHSFTIGTVYYAS